MAIVGLDPARYARRYPSQLSGGERQRVGVARALAADPPIMLMDEPFGAVDPIVRERLQDEFLRLQEEIAKTILFVTHDIDEAIKMGDLVAVFQVGGKLAQFGTPADLLASPASEFVARFVGADRGLKRLRPQPDRRPDAPARADGDHRDDAGEARRRGLADPFGFLLLVGPAGADRLARRRAAAARGAPRRVDGQPDIAAPQQADDPARTRCRCSSTPASRRASSTIGPGRSGPRHDRHDRRADARPAIATPAFPAGARRRPTGPGPGEDGMIPGQPLIDFGWIADHLDVSCCDLAAHRPDGHAARGRVRHRLVARDLDRPQAVGSTGR